MKIQAILKHYGVPFQEGGTHPHVRPGWVGIDCPWCGMRTSKWHLGIHLTGNFASCWRCGSHSLYDVLIEVLKENPSVCYDLVKGLDRGRVEVLPQQRRGKLVIPAGVGPMLPIHRKYLSLQRGLDPDEMDELWGVRGIGLAAEYAWRLWIPVYHHGEIVSWTTRAIGTGSQRYLHAPPSQESQPLKSVLYGGDLVRHAVVVCEGPIDAWTIGPGAVATCGLGYTRSQLLEISKFPIRVVCFDREPAAQKRAKRLARQLQVFPGETHVVELETGKDANECQRSEIMELRKRFLD